MHIEIHHLPSGNTYRSDDLSDMGTETTHKFCIDSAELNFKHVNIEYKGKRFFFPEEVLRNSVIVMVK